MKGHEDVYGNVIADEIASVGEAGDTNVSHIRWNTDESHEMKLLQ